MEDNDGLWTAMFGAAQCFRYAVTKNESVAEIATRNFRGLRLLNHVTSIDGLLARTVSLNKGGADWLKFNASSGAPCEDCDELYWKSGISQDSIIGHLFFLPIYAELVVENVEEQKEVIELFLGIVNHIVENDYQMVDFDGKRTKWGFWDPANLNAKLEYGENRGLNSLQILTFLAAAESLSIKYGIPLKHQYIADHFLKLYTQHGYGKNVLNVKMDWPCNNNFSDDEQAVL